MKLRGTYRTSRLAVGAVGGRTVHVEFITDARCGYVAQCRERSWAKRIARALNLLEAQERKRSTRTGKPDVRYVAAASADQAREFVGENEATWSNMKGAQSWAEKNGLDAWRISVEKVSKRSGKGKRR